MSAYLIAHLNVTDPSWIEDYVANVPAIFRKFGGEYLAVSKSVKQYEGNAAQPDQIAIFTFPTFEALDQFMQSDEYKPFKDARIAGSVATVVGIEA